MDEKNRSTNSCMALVETRGSTSAKLSPVAGSYRCEQMRPGVALVAQTRRALAADEPAGSTRALLAEPHLVLEPDGQALGRDASAANAIQFALQPPFCERPPAPPGPPEGARAWPSGGTGPEHARAWTCDPRGSARPSGPPPPGRVLQGPGRQVRSLHLRPVQDQLTQGGTRRASSSRGLDPGRGRSCRPANPSAL